MPRFPSRSSQEKRWRFLQFATLIGPNPGLPQPLPGSYAYRGRQFQVPHNKVVDSLNYEGNM